MLQVLAPKKIKKLLVSKIELNNGDAYDLSVGKYDISDSNSHVCRQFVLIIIVITY